MKTWAKVAIGLGAVLVLLCVLSGAALVSSGKLNQISGFAGNIMGMKNAGEGLEKLARDFPFTPPADGNVPEARLEEAIAISREIKAVSAPYDAWMETHQNQHGDFKDATEILGLLQKVLSVSVESMRQHKMSSAEFSWIMRQMEKAGEEAAEKTGAGLKGQMLDTLRSTEKSPGLSEASRKELEAKIADFEKQMNASGGELSSNGKLYLKYEEALKECALGEQTSLLLNNSGARGRRRAARAEVKVQGEK